MERPGRLALVNQARNTPGSGESPPLRICSVTLQALLKSGGWKFSTPSHPMRK